jgi:hypothetical protein
VLSSQELPSRPQRCLFDEGATLSVAHPAGTNRAAQTMLGGYVCERHHDRPRDGEHRCGCGGAGMPCPNCNRPEERGKSRNE